MADHPNRGGGSRQPRNAWQQPDVIRRTCILGGIEVRVERLRPHGGGEAMYRVVGEWTEQKGTDDECLNRSECYVHLPPNVAGTVREAAVIANACADETRRMLAKARAATGL